MARAPVEFVRRAGALLVVVTASAIALAHGEVEHADQREEASAQVLAPGYAPLRFEAPQPGTYELPRLGTAADAAVLDRNGRGVNLHEALGNKTALLSFIYTSCNDVNGCPLATAVLRQVAKRLAAQPEVADALRLVSVSFDPAHDTPQVMAEYAERITVDALDWRFVTTGSDAELAPILDAYGQSVQKEYDASGQYTGNISHILRVFLIDASKQIRNIYSVSFLHADTLINDIKTLALERSGATPVPPVPSPQPTRTRGPGDDKTGYESSDYRTGSRELAKRTGKTADLLGFARSKHAGLPPLPTLEREPLTAERVALGRRLFFDRRLSLNDTLSCAMCHIPEQGYTSNEMATAVGLEGQTVRRNAPTLLNVGYWRRLFHDGREDSLAQQVWSPLLARNEMGNPSIGYVIEKIRKLAEYAGLFETAFGRGPSMETLGAALASYQRTLVAGNAPFDRWHYAGDSRAVGEDVKRGFGLFRGKAGCASCHSAGAEHALFTDDSMHNTGIGYQRVAERARGSAEVQLAPGVFVDVDREVMATLADEAPSDLGFYEITQDPADRWKYRTPTLRNAALTAPYMHDGSLTTLQAVVEFYNRGGVDNEELDPLIRPLGLSAAEIADLVAFLESLTSDDVDTLVADAFAAPVGDTE